MIRIGTPWSTNDPTLAGHAGPNAPVTTDIRSGIASERERGNALDTSPSHLSARPLIARSASPVRVSERSRHERMHRTAINAEASRSAGTGTPTSRVDPADLETDGGGHGAEGQWVTPRIKPAQGA